jgi:hypothetical protein
MTTESPALAHALVAWSCGHLSSVDSSYHITALEARSKALLELSKAVSSPDETLRESNAAASLVLMTSEVCLGDHTKWLNHLGGIKHIILSARRRNISGGHLLHGPEALKQSPEGRWILRNFAYHDILGSVTLGHPPLINACYLKGITDEVDTYLGLASEVLILVSEISCLDVLRLANSYVLMNEADPPNTQKSFQVMERALRTWTCHKDGSLTLTALAYTYRGAGLLYLYRQTLRGMRLLPYSSTVDQHRDFHRLLHSRIQTEVASTLQFVTRVPLSGFPEAALLFPLFLIGGEAMDPLHIDLVRTRLQLMLEKRHFHNILRALEVLEDVWKRRQYHQETYDIDWQDAIDNNGGELLLT